MITFILAVCGNVDYVYSFPLSPPSRAAWIEIASFAVTCFTPLSPPSRAAWIEISFVKGSCLLVTSPPSRAAWIEIGNLCVAAVDKKSPPSRAAWIEMAKKGLTYARKKRRRLHGRRGLKFLIFVSRRCMFLSPPSRAAWIEMSKTQLQPTDAGVAAFTGGVD